MACLIIFAVRLAIKRPAKLFGILMGAFFIITVVGVGVYMSGPAIETVPADYQKIMNGELNDKLVDLTGDIEYIESVGELYILKIKTQDGDYIAYTTKDVAGQFPREGDKRVKMYISPSYDENGELVITIISFHK